MDLGTTTTECSDEIFRILPNQEASQSKFQLTLINMFKNKPTIPHPSMSSRYKTNNVENIRFGVLRNNVSSSDAFHCHPSKKISIDPSDGRPNSGRGGKNSESRKGNFLHSTSDFEKEADYN